MRRCPSCGASVVAGRVVCERCGHDVAPTKGDGAYRRGAWSLLVSRAGLRLAAVVVGVAVFAVTFALGVPSKIVFGAVLVAVGALAVWTIFNIFRSGPD